MHENMDHAIPTTFEGQLPQPIWGAREEPREHAQLAVDLYPPFTIKGSAFHAMPHPNIVGTFQPRPIQPQHFLQTALWNHSHTLHYLPTLEYPVDVLLYSTSNSNPFVPQKPHLC